MLLKRRQSGGMIQLVTCHTIHLRLQNISSRMCFSYDAEVSKAAYTRQSALALSNLPGQTETRLCFSWFDVFLNKMEFSIPCILLFLH